MILVIHSDEFFICYSVVLTHRDERFFLRNLIPMKRWNVSGTTGHIYVESGCKGYQNVCFCMKGSSVFFYICLFFSKI